MEKLVLFAGRKRCRGEKEIFTVRYYIVADHFAQDRETSLRWGIRAEKYVEGKKTEESEIKDITSDRIKAEEIAEKLKRNSVTPVSLKDVIMNIISGDVF